jgi:hypothetical protein
MIQAISGELDMIERLQRSEFSGYVHSVFDKTINVMCLENGELYTLACNRVDNAPNTLVIDVNSFGELGINMNGSVQVAHNRIDIGSKLVIAMDHAKMWESIVPSYPTAVELLKINVAKMNRHMDMHGTRGGMKKPLPSHRMFEEAVSSMLLERSEMLLTALLRHEMSTAFDMAVRLVGLGPGLTPSGDDFLVGLFTIFNMPNSPCSEWTDFSARVVQEAQGLTNEISYMAMKKASLGRVRESILKLLHALIAGSQEELLLALDRVLNIGSSSGTDIATGLVRGLEININRGGKICLPKLSSNKARILIPYR